MSPPNSPTFANLHTSLQEVVRLMNSHFLDKHEVIRLLIISAVAGENMLLVGPPGTAKSAMVRLFSKLIDAKCFEYLLTRFTEPNEIFGPIDIGAFREGIYLRRTAGMLPEAEIVFLDEIFKSNSAILNSLLTILNERQFSNSGRLSHVPLISLYGASNEVPNDDGLAAVFDRFLLRVSSTNLDSYHFHGLLSIGLLGEGRLQPDGENKIQPLITASQLALARRTLVFPSKFEDEFLMKYKGLIFQMRDEGISISDRRAVKFLKLFAASALLDGREKTNDSDFFILKHIWNSTEQVEVLEGIVAPLVDRYYLEHPEGQQTPSSKGNLEELRAEFKTIREHLLSGQSISDIYLFSQLRNLGQIRANLLSMNKEPAQRISTEIDVLIEHVLSSSRFG